MEIKQGAVPRMAKIKNRLQELNKEKDLMCLRAQINDALTEFVREYGYIEEKVLIIGRKELVLLYEAHALSDIESTFKLELDDDGFIVRVWSMDIYTGNVDSFIGVFGKTNNIMFVEE